MADIGSAVTGRQLIATGLGASPSFQVSGTGDVTGPAFSTDNAVVRWDGATGKLIQNSSVIIDDSNNISGIGTLAADGNATISRSEAGSSVITTISNEDNSSTSSHAQLLLTTGGTSGGDPKTTYTVTGGTTWSIGNRNDNSDSFEICRSANLNSNEIMIINAATPTETTFAGNFITSVSSTGSAFFARRNTSNTGSAHSQIELQVGGTSAGDAKLLYVISGTGTIWSSGFDNSDSDTFEICQGSAIGTNIEQSITTAGVTRFHHGVAYNVTSTAITYQILVTDYIVSVTDNSAARTISLPTGASVGIGQTFVIKDAAGTAGSANAITIDTAGAETIDGASSVQITTNYGSMTIYYNGTNYFII